MSSPRPKVNPPLCGICMSSSSVIQVDGVWHCTKQRCLRQREHKPIMVTSIEKDEPVSPGLFRQLWAFLNRDIDDDRRPKHPRPEFPFGGLRSPKDTGAPRPEPPQPAPRKGEGYRPRSSGDGPRCGPPKRSCARPLQKCSVCGRSEKVERAADGKLYCGDRPCRRETNMETGRPPRGGSGACPPPPPKKPTTDDDPEPRIEGEAPPITINVAGFVGSEAELASQLSEVIKKASGSIKKVNENFKGLVDAAGKAGDSMEDLGDCIADAEELPEEDYGAAMRAYREERNRRGGVPMYPEDKRSSDSEKKDPNQVPTEKGWSKSKTEPAWSKSKTEPAPETSSAWWTAIKWIIGVGTSIGLGWLIEWAVF